MFQQLSTSVTLVFKTSFHVPPLLRFGSSLLRMSGSNVTFSRLPRSIKPINYKLDFVPNFKDFTFNARAYVELSVSLDVLFLTLVIPLVFYLCFLLYYMARLLTFRLLNRQMKLFFILTDSIYQMHPTKTVSYLILS